MVELSAQPLDGLPERIDQIAAMIPDPPLAVVSTVIPSSTDSKLGCLVVHIPASASAPHKVDGRYVGRGDKTKRYLSDVEVVRLHQLRAANEPDGSALLDDEFARDLLDDDARRQAHLFLLADPLTSRAEMLINITDGDSWEPLLSFRERARAPELTALLQQVGAAQFSPGLQDMQTFRSSTQRLGSLHPRGAGVLPPTASTTTCRPRGAGRRD
ncbi:MAG: hypothetical protein ACR2F6_05840 [Mycobacteriales bacterium]